MAPPQRKGDVAPPRIAALEGVHTKWISAPGKGIWIIDTAYRSHILDRLANQPGFTMIFYNYTDFLLFDHFL